jgi:two-component system chemotaxis response regulator CheB
MTVRSRDLIVVGASAGGVQALRDFVSGLPADLPAAVLIVLHLPAHGTSALPHILKRSGPLPATTARNGDPLEHGRILVAPSDQHILIRDGRITLTDGPTENGHRPAVNALFRSAALVAGPAVAGVLLSGVLDDGVAGLAAIAARGGTVVVQDPAEAIYPSMPELALRHVRADYVLAAADMGAVLRRIALEQVDVDMAPPPDVLLPTPQEVVASRGDGSGPLWDAVRLLDERVLVARRMVELATVQRTDELVERYRQEADEAGRAADALREYLIGALAAEPTAAGP